MLDFSGTEPSGAHVGIRIRICVCTVTRRRRAQRRRAAGCVNQSKENRGREWGTPGTLDAGYSGHSIGGFR